MHQVHAILPALATFFEEIHLIPCSLKPVVVRPLHLSPLIGQHSLGEYRLVLMLLLFLARKT